MGLNFKTSEAQWSYSGFYRFRESLAQEVGIDIDSMEGFGGSISWDEVNSDVKWLISHSDCDGVLSPEKCRIVAPALRSLIQNWPDESYDKINGVLLAESMEVCAENKEGLEFC